MSHFWEDRDVETRGYECAEHDVMAAPGFVVILQGRFDGKQQRVAIEPDHIDEVCRRLHQAKRYARSEKSEAQA